MNSGLPPSRMSVPRPAMLVAMVTELLRPDSRVVEMGGGSLRGGVGV
jgi:hypothetical protein